MTATQDDIKQLQTLLNEIDGEHLSIDGDFGPMTRAALQNAVLKHALPASTASTVSGDHFGAPWIFANIDLLGRDETDPELIARYVPEWKLENPPDVHSYNSLSGTKFAWCQLRWNADRRKVGIKGTDNCGSESMSIWGKHCPYWFGAGLDIQHAKGGRHSTDFLYWEDEANKIAACFGGNQSNKLCVALYNLSGNAAGHDQVMTGPRWSLQVADGRMVSKAEVLAKYPFLKVGGTIGGSTR